MRSSASCAAAPRPTRHEDTSSSSPGASCPATQRPSDIRQRTDPRGPWITATPIGSAGQAPQRWYCRARERGREPCGLTRGSDPRFAGLTPCLPRLAPRCRCLQTRLGMRFSRRGAAWTERSPSTTGGCLRPRMPWACGWQRWNRPANAGLRPANRGSDPGRRDRERTRPVGGAPSRATAEPAGASPAARRPLLLASVSGASRRMAVPLKPRPESPERS